MEKVEGKTVIVTGCTSGIGKETARELARRGCRLIMACRNIEAATRIKNEFIAETGNDQIIVRKLDLSSFKSIREFASVINREVTKLDVLIHNAGVGELFRQLVSVDGLEMTMHTNLYGPFLLTHLLIDLLKSSAPSRIVIVASVMHHYALLNLDKPNPTSYFPAYVYCASKRANIMWTRELARRLQGTGVTANCLHPGIVKTDIMRYTPPPFSWGWALIRKLFFISTPKGARTSVYLATSDEVEGVSGEYFANCRKSWLAKFTKNPEKAKRLWEICEATVRLQPSDPRIG